ncbi:hypothetical protein V8C86DRAFT_2596927 [Haematococcus lacustris]
MCANTCVCLAGGVRGVMVWPEALGWILVWHALYRPVHQEGSERNRFPLAFAFLPGSPCMFLTPELLNQCWPADMPADIPDMRLQWLTLHVGGQGIFDDIVMLMVTFAIASVLLHGGSDLG